MIARLFLAAVAVVSLAAPVRPESPWRFQLTPYVWAVGLSGTIRPLAHAPALQVHRSFGELLSDLDAAFFLNGTVRYNRFVVIGDFTWARVTSEAEARILFISLAGKARVNQITGTLVGGYTIIQQPELAVDLVGGFRAWHVRANASASASVLGLTDQISRSATMAWVDPIIGARMRAELVPLLSVILYADGGGFGIDSRHTWQVVGTVNYQLTNNLFISAGYRHLSVNRHKDGRRLDIDLSGPLFGVTWRF